MQERDLILKQEKIQRENPEKNVRIKNYSVTVNKFNN